MKKRAGIGAALLATLFASDAAAQRAPIRAPMGIIASEALRQRIPIYAPAPGPMGMIGAYVPLNGFHVGFRLNGFFGVVINHGFLPFGCGIQRISHIEAAWAQAMNEARFNMPNYVYRGGVPYGYGSTGYSGRPSEFAGAQAERDRIARLEGRGDEHSKQIKKKYKKKFY